MANLFIEDKDLKILVDILSNYCPNCEVYVYGSRINNKAHEGSDLDIVIKNFPSDKYLFELREKISESNIPFLVDINIYETLPQSFKAEIDKNNIKIF